VPVRPVGIRLRGSRVRVVRSAAAMPPRSRSRGATTSTQAHPDNAGARSRRSRSRLFRAPSNHPNIRAPPPADGPQRRDPNDQASGSSISSATANPNGLDSQVTR
jgi:hypothetical protein